MANKQNKPLFIMSVDQSKAFDRVNRGFMFKVLEKCGFGENFIRWINILYKDTTCKILTNGFLSRNIMLSRGVR